ncbi:Zona pellucida sperm-binding protein 3 [Chelonia mydas]|uniref:Zona pellucida sperm-binding protein 3 n=1 Tax=Chelonia mydas TaxID=8469 RepID=M7AZL4_CHEMY|nr:Zona pellucida sperm-binding protein 3 [Chelonia mydas]
MRGVSSKPDTPIAGTSQALTYSTVLASVKPVAGFLHEDTTANSLSHMLPISKGPRSQSSTSACCPEISPSVSRASTAANITSATLYRELSKTVKFLDKEQTLAAAEVVAKMPPGSSELPLEASSDAPTTELLSSASSAKPQAQPARKHYSLRRPGMRRRLSTPADLVLSHSTTSLPSGTDIQPGPKVHTSPQNKTFPLLPSKTSSDTSVIMKTETNITHSTPLYLNRTGLALLAGSTPTGMEHTPVPITAAGVPVASTTAASEWKPTSATLGEHKVPGVATKAANFSGLASTESPVSVMAPAVGLTSTSTAVSKATPVKNRTAAPLPSPPELSTTTPLTSINLTQSFGPNAPIFQPLTEAKPSVVTSLRSTPSILPTTKTTARLTSARTSTTPGLQLPTVPKTTKLMPWNKTTLSTLLIPPTSTLSTRLLLISQHSSTAKTDLSELTRTMAARTNLTTAAVTAKQVATIKTGLISKQILPESEVPTLSFSPRGKTGSATRPTSPSLQLPVHILSLQFRLIGITYTEHLKNKSSDGYKKLEKEVKLTLNKMLSSYENFLQANVLQFLNGSIIVESEVLFQRDGPAPTNSDLIRTVVTEVERKMDTFFDWRVDVKSVRSNGGSVSGDPVQSEELLLCQTQVVQSLGTLYKVKNFSFVRLRDIKGDLEISGKAYIDTHAHADVSQVLQALRGLVNYSVDLTTLSVDDSRLSLQVFPISFLINNRTVNEKLLDHSSVEHQNLTRDLADVLMHSLRKYQGLLQVVIRDFLSGSLICHGDVVFQHPAPASTDILQTLVLSVGPGHMLAGSGFQVDPYSFTVADDQLEPPFVYPSFPGYAMAIIVMCGLVLIAIPIVALLPYPWARLDASQLRAVSPLQPVMVQCEEAQVVITVHRDLFGVGRLIKAADLSLGLAACQYTSLNAVENTVTFTAGLHECGSTLQMTPDSLVYSTSLNYNPTPASNPVILRTNPAVIPIECHYPRKDNVSSKAIKPTWVPFSSTLSAEERLDFSLHLMNDDWSAERPSSGFQLGEVMHIQADVSTGNHVALRLFVDSCVATLSPDRDSSPRYAVIDFNGCLVDGRSDDTTSAFISPRPRQDTLQFMVDVFRFAGDARNLIYITCHLKVTAAEQAPDPLNKACSFNKAGNISIKESICLAGSKVFAGRSMIKMQETMREQPYPWARADSSELRAVSPLQPVMVQCEEAQMVITVHRDLFGVGRLIKAADLSLGPAACRYTSLNAAENMVTFEAGLHECGSTLQMTPDSLVYSTSLNYNPTPASNPVILRTNPAVIPIECHYPRKDNVSSKAIKPTWVPFSSTLSAEERLDFSLHLMNDDWSAERPSNGFQLGEVMHIQADVSTGNHVALRLFVDSCVATLSPDRDSSPRYAVIDFNGCLVDGRSDDTTSAFISPRPRQDTLQFMVDVFRFAGDARNLIYITCHLKVTAAEQAPDPLNKACSFNKAGNMAVSPLQPVTVQCEEAQMVITVHRDLFGTGRLIKAADLSLGLATCRYTSLNAAENTVTFAAGLHECGSTLQMTPDSLVYSTSLNYNPTPASNPVILRTNPAVIPIECHYPRKDNVSSKAIKPTWVPFSSTLSAEERLDFSLHLMNDDWSAERPSNGFQLGEVMHIAVSDFNGCLVDGRSDDTTSAFISPRPRQDTLQFMVDVFRFAGDARNLIYITCHLKVTAAEQAPDPLNKACSFNKAGNIWSPVEGTRDICRCCETGNCAFLGGQSRRVNPLDRWSGRRFQRDVASRHGEPLVREAEADVVVGPLIILDADQGSRDLSVAQMEAEKAASEGN